MVDRHDIAAVILAGGKSSRMHGQDKALATLAGTRLVDHVYGRIAPQVGMVLVSGPTNYDLDADAVPDVIQGQLGPLAGLHAALTCLRDHHPQIKALISVPVDAPFLPDNLVKRLIAAGGASLAATRSGLQPAFGCWPVGVLDALEVLMQTGAPGAIRHFAQAQNVSEIFFDNEDAFMNINSQKDMEAACDHLSP